MQYLIDFICPKCRTIGNFVFDDGIDGRIQWWRMSNIDKIQENLKKGNTKPICKNCNYYNIEVERELHEYYKNTEV